MVLVYPSVSRWLGPLGNACLLHSSLRIGIVDKLRRQTHIWRNVERVAFDDYSVQCVWVCVCARCITTSTYRCSGIYTVSAKSKK